MKLFEENQNLVRLLNKALAESAYLGSEIGIASARNIQKAFRIYLTRKLDKYNNSVIIIQSYIRKFEANNYARRIRQQIPIELSNLRAMKKEFEKLKLQHVILLEEKKNFCQRILSN